MSDIQLNECSDYVCRQTIFIEFTFQMAEKNNTR